MMAVLSMTAAALEEQQNQEWSTQPLTAGALPVLFENVTFGYDPASSVLRNVTFDVAPGKKVGIIGKTGAGKSTIINLLCGFVAPNAGRVLIGGVDASLIPPPVFASRVAVLSQRSHVFSASVRDNISLFSTQISDNQLWKILEKLDAARWIKKLPQGLDTMIGAGGRVLSKGEMQLLMGARVLLRPSNLLIIDEGTSVMDVQSELSWTKLIETVSKGLTVIMVEHRHTAIREARSDRDGERTDN
jgi:ABC-type multidrug transport system fused ATPase/permease subunit